MASGSVIRPLSNEIISLRMSLNLINVHPVMYLVFKSSMNLQNMSSSIICLDDSSRPATDATLYWDIMSYTATLLGDGKGWMYSCYCFPCFASERIGSGQFRTASELITKFSPSSPSLSLIPNGGKLLHPIPSLPSTDARGNPIPDLTPRAINDPLVEVASTQTNAYWTLSYALMHAKMVALRQESGASNPDNWYLAAQNFPVFFLAGSTLFSTTFARILSKPLDGVGTTTSSQIGGIDKQWFYQSKLNSYMLAANERKRTLRNLEPILFRRVMRLKSQVAFPFMRAFNLEDIKDPDFPTSANPYILYKSTFNTKDAPFFWTHSFGSMA